MTTPTSNIVNTVTTGGTSTANFINVLLPRDPTPYDLNYQVQKRWINTETDVEWILINFITTNGITVANWKQIGSGSFTAETLTGNSGGAVSPNGANNIFTVGDATSINVIGNPGTNTLTANVILPANHDVLISHVSSIAGAVPSATVGVPLVSAGASADPAFGTATVPGGGTGDVSFIPYTPICGGITNVSPLQSVVSTGTAGQVLTSNGSGALPTFESIAVGTGPQFFASLNSDDNNVTGNNATYYLGTNVPLTIRVDTTGSFNTNGTFTAPVTGNYLIGMVLEITNIGTSSSGAIGIVPSSGNSFIFIQKPANSGDEGGMTYAFTSLVPLTSGETVRFNVLINGAGANTVGLNGDPTLEETYVYGYLIESAIPLSGELDINTIVVDISLSPYGYTPSMNLQYAIVECIGGGGGGGGTATCSGSQASGGGGGGGGGYARKTLSATAIGMGRTVIVGAAGTGGSPGSGGPAGGGGTTFFGDIFSATGGNGGDGSGANPANFITSAGSGGNGVGGDINVGGSGGGTGFSLVTAGGGGQGGNSALGGGIVSVNSTVTGNTGSPYGGGGGGAVTSPGGGQQTGGAGSPGLCIITEFIVS